MDYVLAALKAAGPSTKDELYRYTSEHVGKFGELDETLDQGTISICIDRLEVKGLVAIKQIDGVERYKASKRQRFTMMNFMKVTSKEGKATVKELENRFNE
jgi:predicted transcriptional regulator